jgi:hypothetical protein
MAGREGRVPALGGREVLLFCSPGQRRERLANLFKCTCTIHRSRLLPLPPGRPASSSRRRRPLTVITSVRPLSPSLVRLRSCSEHPTCPKSMPPANAAAAAPSANSKRQRACLLCSLLLSSSDFRKLGCPNCDEILRMKGSSDKVTSCTSAQYDGVIAVVKEGSWVSKWQRTGPSPSAGFTLQHLAQLRLVLTLTYLA